MTSEEHNKYLSWTFLGNGLFQSGMLLLIFAFIFAFISIGPPDPSFPGGIFAAVFAVVFILNLVFISPNFVAYYALKNRKPWARIAAIVAGILSAMNVPIGTAACAYSLWYFFGEEWKSVYPEVASRENARGRLNPQANMNWSGQYVDQNGEVVYRPSTPPDWR